VGWRQLAAPGSGFRRGSFAAPGSGLLGFGGLLLSLGIGFLLAGGPSLGLGSCSVGLRQRPSWAAVSAFCCFGRALLGLGGFRWASAAASAELRGLSAGDRLSLSLAAALRLRRRLSGGLPP
jgi:hypothetical protein